MNNCILYKDFNIKTFKAKKMDRYLHHDIIHELLLSIYNFKIQGIDNSLTDIFLNNKNKIIMTKTVSSVYRNIKIYIIELNFLKSIKNAIKHYLFAQCVECGVVHGQHKYKECGCNVNYFCAYNRLNKTNHCGLCKKNIIKHDIKLEKDTNKDNHANPDRNECSICLEECNTKLSSCGHYFHKTCINSYYNFYDPKVPITQDHNNNCPLCRKKLVSMADFATRYNNTKFSLGRNKEGLVDIIIQVI